jgi:hypothetical protein
MKRAAYLIASLVVASVIALMLYWHWLFIKYPEHAVTEYTGITNLQTLQKAHSDYDWYIKANLSPSDGERALKRHPFQPGFHREILQGKLDNPYLTDCHTCWSYFEGRGHGPYGYVLMIVSEDKKQLQMYELFGD